VGRVSRGVQRVARPGFRDELSGLPSHAGDESLLAIGPRRSYGDSCLNRAGAVVDMSGLDRFIAFDAATGVLRAEAGASLSEILRLVVPKGWFRRRRRERASSRSAASSPTTFTARIIMARARSGDMFAPLGCCAAIAGR